MNVALNRPAYQVSVYSDQYGTTFPANNANDGNHETDLRQGPCMHTFIETNPWWAVDLLVPLYVAGVNFTNRQPHGTSERELYKTNATNIVVLSKLDDNFIVSFLTSFVERHIVKPARYRGPLRVVAFFR